VKKDPARLEEMLSLTGGDRRVPVLVQDGKVTVGYGGT
jgi:glutaredoxin 3